MEPEKILVTNVSGIGDFVDSVPALRLLRKARPEARVTLLVSEKAFPLARLCPYADEVVCLPTSRGRNMPAWRGLPRWAAVIWRLRGRFTTVIHLYEISSWLGERWTRLLAAWIGPRASFGRLTAGRGMFFTSVAPDSPEEDNLDAYLKVVSLALSYRTVPRPIDKKLELWIPEQAAAQARTWLKSLALWGKLDGPLVVVALGGDRRTRHELPERAQIWLAQLQAKFRVRPVLFGMPSDPGLPPGAGVVCADARGLWDIVGSAALLSLADAVVTTHSVPQHMAGVWGIPVIVLVGPGDSQKYRPHMAAEKMRLLIHPVACAPCYYRDCPWSGPDHQKCLREVPPEAVVEAFGAVVPTIAARAH